MAKKHFGKLLTLAAIVGAAAAGVSYVLQYKSFHKELDEDFHDFEDDFDDFDDAGDKEASKTSDTAASERSYVSLNPEKRKLRLRLQRKLLNILRKAKKLRLRQMSLPKNRSKQKPSAQMLRFPRTAKLLPRKRIPTQPRMTAQP